MRYIYEIDYTDTDRPGYQCYVLRIRDKSHHTHRRVRCEIDSTLNTQRSTRRETDMKHEEFESNVNAYVVLKSFKNMVQLNH
jgi:hypothetical protein